MAADALGKLAENLEDALLQKIFKAGALPALVALLKKGYGTKEQAASTLRKLAFKSEERSAAIGEAGAL